jgi:hypothetical protein
MLSPKTKLLLLIVAVAGVLALVLAMAGLRFPNPYYGAFYFVTLAIALLLYGLLSKIAEKQTPLKSAQSFKRHQEIVGFRLRPKPCSDQRRGGRCVFLPCGEGNSFLWLS